jgi:hypothetical protein
MATELGPKVGALPNNTSAVALIAEGLLHPTSLQAVTAT